MSCGGPDVFSSTTVLCHVVVQRFSPLPQFCVMWWSRGFLLYHSIVSCGGLDVFTSTTVFKKCGGVDVFSSTTVFSQVVV